MIQCKTQLKQHDFIDTLSFRWPQSWHLHPNYTSVGMNILGAWKQGYKGKGVTVVHLDDGLDYWHPDLWNAYDASVSYDFQDDDNLPFPHDNQTHGTAMAGIVAARANNTVCSVGIAHEATIGMRREALTRSIKTYGSKQARIIAYKMDQVDIYVFGYGPRDRGNGVQAPSDLVVEAIENGECLLVNESELKACIRHSRQVFKEDEMAKASSLCTHQATEGCTRTLVPLTGEPISFNSCPSIP